MTKLLVTFGSEILALIMVIIAFKKLNPSLKIIAIQVCIALVVEVFGFWLKKCHTSNIFLYNLYLPVDFALLTIAVFRYLPSGPRNYLYSISSIVFLVLWGKDLATNGISVFAKTAYIFESVIVLILYLVIIYRTIVNDSRKIRHQALFWLSCGLIIFYGCNIPYFSIIDFLTRTCTKEQTRLLYSVFIYLVGVRYVFVAISFYVFSKYGQQEEI